MLGMLDVGHKCIYMNLELYNMLLFKFNLNLTNLLKLKFMGH